MKYALVTGGSRGIGKAISLKLAEMGYFVLINFQKNMEEANKTKNLIQEAGGNSEIMKFDVSNEEEVNKVLGNWLQENPDKIIEVLINNAGIKKDVLFMWMQAEDWKNVLNTSLNGFFYVTKLILNGMLLKKYGRIINIVSVSGQKGVPGQANYSAAKAGLIGATKSLAMEVGRRNITVNAVAPGFIITDMTEGLNEKDFKQLIPLNRFGLPHEVADAVGFLASEKASYITGEVLSVNGGMGT